MNLDPSETEGERAQLLSSGSPVRVGSGVMCLRGAPKIGIAQASGDAVRLSSTHPMPHFKLNLEFGRTSVTVLI